MAKSGVRKKVKKSILLNIGFTLAFVVFVVACVAYIVDTQSGIAEKEAELAQLNQRVEQAQDENGEYRQILSGDGYSDYIEEIAIDEFGYAYPGEIRFYDMNRN